MIAVYIRVITKRLLSRMVNAFVYHFQKRVFCHHFFSRQQQWRQQHQRNPTTEPTHVHKDQNPRYVIQKIQNLVSQSQVWSFCFFG